MLILGCLVNFVFYAAIALAVLWVLSSVLSQFGLAVPPPTAPPLNILYLLIGLILLLNFLICVFGGGHQMILPPLWRG